MALNKFITEINNSLCNLVERSIIYGRAESVIRKSGTVTETLPGIRTGTEYKYVGPDDVFELIIYHKLTGITTEAAQTNRGFGDNISDTKNTYSLSLFAYLDQAKTNISIDDLFLTVQANIPSRINMFPYSNIIIRFTSVNLNGEQIFASEFRGTDFKLPLEKAMFQINYTIESSFKKDCFVKCPEDLNTLKN